MLHLRNFSIIAHVDHGKSTLADCFIRTCNALSEREMVAQVLDSLELERARGITIKAQTVTLMHTGADGKDYVLNLIDTPGHADFSYEVSRSLAACEGALLVVDAAQGVEAQTLATCYKAVAQGLEIIPVLNKIDLPSADPARVSEDIRTIVGLPTDGLLACSAKTGQGVDELLAAVITKIPAPSGDPAAPLQALVLDSWFDAYAGVVILLRLFNGSLSKGGKFRFMAGTTEHHVNEIGQFRPRATPLDGLACGEVGYVIAGIKDLSVANVGDTVTTVTRPAVRTLPGFKRIKPQLFASFFPLEANLFPQLREAFERLRLNDASLTMETENSVAFGQGLRCGFLGLLHMEIVQERLELEHQVSSIITAPSVTHEVVLTDGTLQVLCAAAELPIPERIREIREPYADVTILVPGNLLGEIIQLCIAHRGKQEGVEQSGTHALSRWSMPLAELVTGFVGELKSVSHGYASMDYEITGYQTANIARVDILVNGDRIDALALLVPRGLAERRARDLLVRLKEAIPRQQFQVPLQAAIGGKIIAREDIRALRKNVLAKCYGGDVTRKKKLIERQKRGKRRMRKFGRVEMPQEAFLAVLQQGSGSRSNG